MSDRPFEIMYGGLSGIIRGCESVRAGLNKATRHVLDPDGKVRSRCDKLQAEAERSILHMQDKLAKERKETVATERLKDKWASPSCIEGWLCPDSPTGVCVYGDSNKLDPDWCDYCEHPGERK